LRLKLKTVSIDFNPDLRRWLSWDAELRIFEYGTKQAKMKGGKNRASTHTKGYMLDGSLVPKDALIDHSKEKKVGVKINGRLS
jgi:hypothetical protein